MGKSARFISSHQDKVAYILHKIYENQTFNFRNHQETFANLKHDRLALVVGRRYVTPLMSLLLGAGIIQCDRHFIIGEKALGYRIIEDYHSPIVCVPIFKKAFSRRLKHLADKEATGLISNQLLVNIHKDIKALRIDYVSAYQFNRNAYEATERFLYSQSGVLDTNKITTAQYLSLIDLAAIESNVRLPSLGEFRQIMRHCTASTVRQALLSTNLNAYCANSISIQKIHEQDFHIPKRPVPGSRVYTNLTNLSSALRPFLYHKKHPGVVLYNIDIKNSQPFLLNVLLREKYLDDLPADVEHYLEATANGTFYEKAALLMGINLSGNDKDSFTKAQTLCRRGQFKKAFFGNIFFCENLHTETSKAWVAFQNEYPTVAAFIREAKQDDYRALANRMQYVEAQIILEQIVRRLQKAKVWCASIHDSVVCMEPDKATVKSVMLEVFQNQFNLLPSLKEEALGKE